MASEANKTGEALEPSETGENDELDPVPEETQKTLGNDAEGADGSNSPSAIEEGHSAQGQLSSDGGNPFKKFSLVGAITLGFLVALGLAP